jgi:hypothetical protein
VAEGRRVGPTFVLAQQTCLDPRNSFLDYVDGGYRKSDCTWLRNLRDDDRCGPDAKWFRERQPGEAVRVA